MKHDFRRRRHLGGFVLDKLFYKCVGIFRARARRVGKFPHIVVPVDDEIGMRVISTGVFESTQLDALEALLDSPERYIGMPIDRRGLFVDVGANIGLYTLNFSRYFDKVLSLEANPVTFKVLEANIAISNTGNAVCVCCGVSDKTGASIIYLPTNGNLGWGTLGADHHQGPTKKIPIQIDTLDNISKANGMDSFRVSLIKIDVEGHELEVLRGSVGILGKWSPVILFEVLHKEPGVECIRLLKECGYTHFYGFRRGFLSKGGNKRELLRNLVQGLPIYIEEIDITNCRPAALVCAVMKAVL